MAVAQRTKKQKNGRTAAGSVAESAASGRMLHFFRAFSAAAAVLLRRPCGCSAPHGRKTHGAVARKVVRTGGKRGAQCVPARSRGRGNGPLKGPVRLEGAVRPTKAQQQKDSRKPEGATRHARSCARAPPPADRLSAAGPLRLTVCPAPAPRESDILPRPPDGRQKRKPAEAKACHYGRTGKRKSRASSRRAHRPARKSGQSAPRKARDSMKSYYRQSVGGPAVRPVARLNAPGGWSPCRGTPPWA